MTTSAVLAVDVAADFLWAVGSLCNLRRRLFDATLVQREFPPPHTPRACRSAALARPRRACPCSIAAACESACREWRSRGSISPAADATDGAPAHRRSLGKVRRRARARVPGRDQRAVGARPLDDLEAAFTGATLEVASAAAARRRRRRGSADARVRLSLVRPGAGPPSQRLARRPARLARRSSSSRSRRRCAARSSSTRSIVHQTTSTLAVIAFALGVFVVFGGALNWVRQYLVTHTGNRVDAVLGAAVFRHLVRCRCATSSGGRRACSRRGCNGVETIREFLSGAAVTLILDLPFLLLVPRAHVLLQRVAVADDAR